MLSIAALLQKLIQTGVAPFDPDNLYGRDPELISAILPFFDLYNERYLRLQVDGAQNIPEGPAIFVGNHNGGIAGPDLSCTMATLWHTLGPEAPLYALAHDFAMRQATPLGRVLQRFGGLRASRENALRVLASGGKFLVYPGGDIEAYRPSSQRDEVIFGERTGFVRIAQKMGVPIVPIVAYGAHRCAWILSDGEWLVRLTSLKRLARVERFPIALALPWGLALGPWIPYMHLPFPIKLQILAPVSIPATVSPSEAQEEIRLSMQRALSQMSER